MSRRSTRRRDPGLTFIETLIVTMLIGLVAVVIAAAFSTIVRTAAPTQYRIDDARSTRGLQTWLVRDIASTPTEEMTAPADLDPGGFVFGSDPFLASVERCGAAGTNLIHMTWVDAASSVSYHANYTLDGDTVYRTTCSSASPAGDALRLTGDVSSTFCTSAPFLGTKYVEHYHEDLDGDSVPDEVASVDICLRSFESDTGLNAGGGDTREILLSVSSRNYVETP